MNRQTVRIDGSVFFGATLFAIGVTVDRWTDRFTTVRYSTQTHTFGPREPGCGFGVSRMLMEKKQKRSTAS